MDLLIVNFDEAATNEVVLACIVLRDCYDLAEGARYDAAGLLRLVTAHHGVGLSTASLSVSEDSSVVAVEDVVD